MTIEDLIKIAEAASPDGLDAYDRQNDWAFLGKFKPPVVVAMLKAMKEMREALELIDTGERDNLRAPEDSEVKALCERVGYGAVMDSAARQWRAKPIERGGDIGAHTSGPCVGTVRQALKASDSFLEGVG
jgi:hypothetical protein